MTEDPPNSDRSYLFTFISLFLFVEDFSFISFSSLHGSTIYFWRTKYDWNNILTRNHFQHYSAFHCYYSRICSSVCLFSIMIVFKISLQNFFCWVFEFCSFTGFKSCYSLFEKLIDWFFFLFKESQLQHGTHLLEISFLKQRLKMWKKPTLFVDQFIVWI
jgi:hypothetical protein